MRGGYRVELWEFGLLGSTLWPCFVVFYLFGLQKVPGAELVHKCLLGLLMFDCRALSSICRSDGGEAVWLGDGWLGDGGRAKSRMQQRKRRKRPLFSHK